MLQKLGEGFSVFQENIHGFSTPITSKYKVYPSMYLIFGFIKKILLNFIPLVQWDKPYINIKRTQF